MISRRVMAKTVFGQIHLAATFLRQRAATILMQIIPPTHPWNGFKALGSFLELFKVVLTPKLLKI